MYRKRIKIAFVDFWDHWNPNDNFIVNILKDNYDVEISDEPDYVFFSNFNPFFDHMKYQNCVKIFYTQENLCPDFNFADYGIGFEKLNFGDRYLRFPLCFVDKRYDRVWEKMTVKHETTDIAACAGRKFCSFVVSNDKASVIRKQIYEKLSTYKRVDSGGKYMNNVGMPTGVPDKLSFEKEHKFSICFENSRHPGYMTEKIVEAFAAGTVPIYWGDPCVNEIFNSDSFIDVGSFPSVEQAIEYIKMVDQDDDLYRSMIETPALLEENTNIWDQQQEALRAFLFNIFNQDKEEAYRRNRTFWGEIYYDQYNAMRKVYVRIYNNFVTQVLRVRVNKCKAVVKKVIQKWKKV